MVQRLPFFLLIIVLLFSCTDQEGGSDIGELTDEQRRDSIAAAEAAREQAHIDSLRTRFPKITYHQVEISDRSMLDSILKIYGKRDETWDAYRVLTLLNRKDTRFLRIGDTIVLPDTVMEDLRAYSVFPQYYAGAKDIPKIIMVSNALQCYACYENGELVRFSAANTGEERKPTFPGRYAINWKHPRRISSLDSTWIMPFTVNFHLYAGSAAHEFEMPGRPVSHSCVRQFLSDAKWLFNWVDQGRINKETKRIIPMTGTPLIIIDVFDFNRKRGGPWMELSSNRDVELTLPDKPMEVEEALIPISQIPETVRGGLPDKARYVKAEEILRERGQIREGVSLRASIDYNKLRKERRQAKERERKRKADSSAMATPPSGATD
jgi:hypothetical protein